MARVAPEEIDRLKREVPLERLAASRGVELRKHGAQDLVGLCAFHEEQSPSMVLSPAKKACSIASGAERREAPSTGS